MTGRKKPALKEAGQQQELFPRAEEQLLSRGKPERQRLVIEGGVALRGSVRVSGAKNAVLTMMAAALLAEGTTRLKNVPRLGDISRMKEILRLLGMRVERVAESALELEVVDRSPTRAPYELVEQLRASICVLGPLLVTRGRAEVAYPGGCSIGSRPVNLHIKGIKELGAEIDVQEGYIRARVGARLRGARMFLGGDRGPTVLGTQNMMMAACLAEGVTIIEDAASEPEVQELANLLNAMGAKISGIGTRTLAIEGVSSLRGVEYEVIPDRIEAATLIIAGAMTRGDILVQNAREDHLGSALDCLRQIGVRLETEAGGLRVTAPGALKALNITTAPYPGFPTDVQSPIMALLAIADGTSVITEKIFDGRFAQIDELNRMRANIRRSGESAIITGMDYLSGAPVHGKDLRGSAALVLAGLVARGETNLIDLSHLDRGYEDMEVKLRGLGARIERRDRTDI